MKTYSEFPELSDWKLLTDDGSEFRIHRIILVRRSEYFRAMFCGISKDKTEFTIPGINSICLRDILHYVYTESIRVTEENVVDLLIAADYLLLKDLYLDLKEKLRSNMTDANRLKILKIPGLVNEETYEDCFRFAETRFEWVLSCDKDAVANLPFESLERVLRSRSLYVLSETTAWQAIVIWTKKDILHRLSCGPRLLLSLAIAEVEEELAAEILQHEIITKNDDLLKDLNKIKSSNESINNLEIFCKLLYNRSFNISEPCYFRIPINMYMVCYRRDLYVTYDEKADLWNKIFEFDFQPDVIKVIGHNIYTFELKLVENNIGDDDHFFIRCKNFDLTRKEWIPMENFRNSIVAPSIIAIDQYIYVVCTTYKKWDGDIQIYDTKTNRWFQGNTLPNFFYLNAVYIERKIYVTGFNDDFNGKIMNVFDSVSKQWSSLSSPNEKNCERYALVEYRHKIYILGGAMKNDKAEVYDPATNLWKDLPAIPHSYQSIGAIVWNEQMFLYEADIEKRQKNFRWNFEKECWERVEIKSDLRYFAYDAIGDIETIKMMTKQNRVEKFQMQKTLLKFHNWHAKVSLQ